METSIRDPKDICNDFHTGVMGLADIDVSSVVHEIIVDVLRSVELAGRAMSESSNRNAVKKAVHVAQDYYIKHYGEL